MTDKKKKDDDEPGDKGNGNTSKFGVDDSVPPADAQVAGGHENHVDHKPGGTK